MATQKLHKATGKMTQLCRKIVHMNIRCSIIEKTTVFRQLFRCIWDRILVCSTRMSNPRYRRLFPRRNSPPSMKSSGSGTQEDPGTTSSTCCYESDSDLVSLKISVLGDSQIGKTSFLIKYVGDEQEKRSLQMKGLNVMDKTMLIKGARIALRIWDVGGDNRSFDQVPIACKDAVAILFMFDLTSRCSLNSIVGWYSEARKWNQTVIVSSMLHEQLLPRTMTHKMAIPILIGTKFDDFVQLPPDIQWPVATQARGYARAMKATLFFSSAKHNINVNKIFKFIMAELFNLPWTVQRNLTIGEPIIDF